MSESTSESMSELGTGVPRRTVVAGEPRRYLAMLALFVLGLMGGIWTVIAPFVLNWPSAGDGSWTDPVRDTVITGAVLTGASAVAIVLSAGFAARAAVLAAAVETDKPA